MSIDVEREDQIINNLVDEFNNMDRDGQEELGNCVRKAYQDGRIRWEVFYNGEFEGFCKDKHTAYERLFDLIKQNDYYDLPF